MKGSHYGIYGKESESPCLSLSTLNRIVTLPPWAMRIGDNIQKGEELLVKEIRRGAGSIHSSIK